MTGTLPLVVHEFSPATVGGTEVYTDLTNRWHSKVTISRGKQYERGQAQAGRMTCTYRNNDGYLTPGYSSSAYSGGVVLYAPIRVRAQYPATPNLLSQDQATAGEGSPVAPGVIPSSMNVISAIGTPSIAWSGSAWQGSQVYQLAVPASSSLFDLVGVTYLPVQSTSGAARATQYSFSAYCRSTTSGATPSVEAQIRWYNSSGTEISATLGTVTALATGGSGTWTRVQVNGGTPPSGAIYAAGCVVLEGTAPSGAWTFQMDGLQFEIGPVASTWTLPGIWYYMFQGIVERWPQTWGQDSSGNYTVTQVTATDLLSLLGRQKLNYVYLEYLLALNPRWLFQLNEQSNGYTPPDPPSGEGSFGYVSMAWADTVGELQPIYAFSQDWSIATVTPGVQPVSLSVSGGQFTGTPGPVLQLTSGADSGGTLYSECLSIDNTNTVVGPPQGGSGWSVVVAFNASVQPDYPTSQYFNPFMWATAQNTTYQSDDWAGISINTGGTVQTWVGSGGTWWNVGFSGNLLDGNWHLVCMTISASGGVMTSFLDGQAQTDNIAGAGAPSFSSGRTFNYENIGAYPGPNAGWVGYLALVCEFEYALSQSQFNTLYAAWRDSFAGDSTGSRIERIFDVAGFDFPISIQPGLTTMGPAGDWSSTTAGLPFQGQSVLSLCQQAVDAEQGQMYVSANGTFTFTNRAYRSPAPSPLLLTTFGENVAGWILGDTVESILGETTVLDGEIPYTLPVQIGYDADQAYTVAQITQYDGLPPVTGTAGSTITIENAAANGPLGIQLYTENLNINTLAQTTEVAQWIADNGSVEDMRVTSLTVDLSGFTALMAANAWPQLLALDINTAVAVNRRPLGGAPLTLTQWVEQITWNLDPSKPTATVTYQMSPVSKSLG